MIVQKLYELFLQNPVISTDSRNIPQNCIFFALKGENFDGNNFALQAIELGAKYAIIDNKNITLTQNLILVNDVLTTLQQLAAYHRKELGIPILAITGTNGKTTTKELVASVLSSKFITTFTQGNLNNHIGVPLTLLKMTANTEIGVVEMGANHSGEIRDLCQIADPDYGLITNIGKAHLEGFGSFEGVINTKTELYAHIRSKNGKLFVNESNTILKNQLKPLDQIIYYGENETVFLKGEIVSQTPYLNLRAWFPSGILYLNTKLIGSYNFENVLAAACIGKFFGIDPLVIQKSIKNYLPQNNRSQLTKKGTIKIIMDAYNANPSSMHASIENFFLLQGENKLLILGDMLELGQTSAQEHQKLVTLIETKKFEKVFLIGENFSKTKTSKIFTKFISTNELLTFLKSQTFSDLLVLVKGSRKLQLEKVENAF